MEIRSIKLINFRQFKNVEVEFSCDKEKNVTVIVGNNTSGKTTMVKAFIWGLYRINLFKEDKILLNKDVQDKLLINEDKDAKVVIELDHNNCSYTITTKEEYIRTPSGIRVKTKAHSNIIKCSSEGTDVVPQIKVEEEINSILSPTLKDYFFFDGEDNKIDEVSKKSNLKDAVSNLMGLKRMEELNEYYNPNKYDSVTSKLKSKLVSKDEGNLVEYFDLLNTAQEKLSQYENELDSIRNNIVELKAQYQEKEDLIDANQDVKEDQKRKKELNDAIINGRKYRDDKFKELISSLNNSNSLLKILFSKSFFSNNLEVKLKETTFKSTNSLKHISEEAIDLIIQRGTCLCGTKLYNRQDLIDHLNSEKEHMEPRDFGKYASDFSDLENNNMSYTISMSENIISVAETLVELITNIDTNKDNLKEVEKRIIGRVNVGELQQDAIRIREQIINQESKADYIENTIIPSKKEDIKKYNDKIEKLTAQTSGNEFIQACIDYAEFIFDRTSKKINQSKTQIRVDLEKIVNEVFKSMYHGKREIVIDNNFNADARLIGNVKLDKSNGLETVKNFAFVTGLMSLIKDKVLNPEVKEDTFVEGDCEIAYPLVMDAPFSDTDEIHIKNICKVLPLHCNQVIIIVMNKDFESAKDALEHRISKKYSIVKRNNSETDSIIEEVF